MNPHLQLLLSPVYDGALVAAHRADLEQSGLTEATVRQQFIRSVPPAVIAPLLGFDPSGVVSALLFPFRAPAGGFMDFARVKIFPSGQDAAGHTVKYLQRKGSAPRLYFCAATMAAACTGSEPLWIAEGEKKALALAQLGVPVVGICGIHAWHPRGSRELLPDFDALALAGRTVELVPDGDWQTNRDVADGVAWLASALRFRGARPRMVVLPQANAA